MTGKKKIQIPEFCPVDLNSLPMKLPNIEIDQAKCRIPFWCKKCLENCPHLVFWVDNVHIERFKEADPRQPGVYKLMAVRRDKCTVCGKCVELCPEGALTVSYGDTVLKGTKKMDTVAEAAKSNYPVFEASNAYSFDLNEDMLNQLHREFDPQDVVGKFVEAIAGKKKAGIDKLARELFGEYGAAWFKRAMQLGEEYPDRTYELLKEIIDETGEGFFPHVPQRYIEIAYIGTQPTLQLPVLENYRSHLLYRVPDCYTYKLLSEKGGADVAKQMPCQHACLNGLETLFHDLNLDVVIKMTASTAKEGYCEFSIKPV